MTNLTSKAAKLEKTRKQQFKALERLKAEAFNNWKNGIRINVYNRLTILKFDVAKGINNNQMDVTPLADATYFITVEVGERFYTSKFVNGEETYNNIINELLGNEEIVKKCYSEYLFNDNCLRIAPPLIISEAEIKDSCDILLESMDEVQKEKGEA